MAEITKKKDDVLEESAASNVTAFSYQFKDELKITTTKKEQEAGEDDEEDFERNDLENLGD